VALSARDFWRSDVAKDFVVFALKSYFKANWSTNELLGLFLSVRHERIVIFALDVASSLTKEGAHNSDYYT
jgi:hypothetical protein